MIVQFKLVHNFPDISTINPSILNTTWWLSRCTGSYTTQIKFSLSSVCRRTDQSTDMHIIHTTHAKNKSFPLRQTSVRIHSDSTLYVQISIYSRNRTIHNVYHISLHSSSWGEPTHKSVHSLHYTFRYNAEYTRWAYSRNFIITNNGLWPHRIVHCSMK